MSILIFASPILLPSFLPYLSISIYSRLFVYKSFHFSDGSIKMLLFLEECIQPVGHRFAPLFSRNSYSFRPHWPFALFLSHWFPIQKSSRHQNVTVGYRFTLNFEFPSSFSSLNPSFLIGFYFSHWEDSFKFLLPHKAFYRSLIHPFKTVLAFSCWKLFPFFPYWPFPMAIFALSSPILLAWKLSLHWPLHFKPNREKPNAPTPYAGCRNHFWCDQREGGRFKERNVALEKWREKCRLARRRKCYGKLYILVQNAIFWNNFGRGRIDVFDLNGLDLRAIKMHFHCYLCVGKVASPPLLFN